MTVDGVVRGKGRKGHKRSNKNNDTLYQDHTTDIIYVNRVTSYVIYLRYSFI